MHRSLTIGAAAATGTLATAAASLALFAAPGVAATTSVPLSFNHVVLDLPSTGDAQLVTPTTKPLTVTADVDPTTGDFTVDPSSFSAPAYHFTSPLAGTATLSLKSTATGTINFATGALTMTGDFLADVNLGADGSCVIDTGSQTLTTATKKPLAGQAFPAGVTGPVTGDGAFGVSWSTLPPSTNGSGCEILNTVVDGPGGLWISRGISPTAASALTVPKSVSVTAGKSVKVAVTLAPAKAAKSVKVCLVAKSPLSASACQTVKAVKAGSKHKLSFTLSAKKGAKAGSYKATVTATGQTSATLAVKVK